MVSSAVDDPAVRGVVINVRDVSDAVRAREEAAAQGQRLQMILDTVHEGIWHIDSECRVTFASQHVAEQVGRPLDEIVGQPLHEVLANDEGEIESRVRRRRPGQLEQYERLCRRVIDRHRGRLVKSIGDGLLVTFDGPGRAIRAALAMRDTAHSLGLELRAGAHTGECEVIGEKYGGIAVHIGARVAACAGPGEVLVSSTVKDLVAGSGLAFEDRGRHPLKGVTGDWQLYAVAH